MRKIYVKRLQVPEDAILEVATLLAEHEITNEIVGSNEDEELIFLELRYEKDEKEAIAEIMALTNVYENEEEEKEEEEEDK